MESYTGTGTGTGTGIGVGGALNILKITAFSFFLFIHLLTDVLLVSHLKHFYNCL